MLDTFITQLRKRLNLSRLLQYGAWSLLIGALLALLYALSFLVRGHAVPPLGYLVCILLPIVIALLVSWMKRSSLEQGVRFADKHFDLKDALISAWHFEKIKAPTDAHQLVVEQSEDIVKGLSVESVPLNAPRRLYFGSGCLLILLIILAMIPASQSVLDAQRLAGQVLAQSEETREELEDALDALEESLDEDEAETVDMEALRRAVEELEATEDQREAMRQLARIEQQVSEQLAALEQRSDEVAVQKMAEALEKVQNPESRKLAEDLKEKDYKEAAEQMEEMAPNLAQMSELSEQQKELARLRALSKPMAQAVSDLQNLSMMKQGSEKDASDYDEQNMASLASELDQNAQEMEGLLDQQEFQQSQNSEQCENASDQISQSLSKMSEQLSKMQAKSNMQAKLDAFRKMLSQAQGQAPGQMLGKMPGMAQVPGGQGAGEGSDQSRRDQQDPLINNGQFSSLKGQKNEGPSLSKVEEASSGSGVSNRTGSETAREYQRQFESFVQRDDIPDTVKFAVSDYFKSIHQYEPLPTLDDEPETPLSE